MLLTTPLEKKKFSLAIRIGWETVFLSHENFWDSEKCSSLNWDVKLKPQFFPKPKLWRKNGAGQSICFIWIISENFVSVSTIFIFTFTINLLTFLNSHFDPKSRTFTFKKMSKHAILTASGFFFFSEKNLKWEICQNQPFPAKSFDVELAFSDEKTVHWKIPYQLCYTYCTYPIRYT